MGQYLSPSLAQVEQAKIKCAIIWYPADDGDFFLNAVRGALADLRFPYNWEGDSELVQAIAQRFIETDLLTDKYFFNTDCELIEELTDNGDSEMAVNVTVTNNCGCGCSGGGGTVINNTVEYPNPTSTTIPPLDNILPIDDGVSIPDGFDTYEEYRTYKCGVATQMVDDFTETIGNLQTLGGLVAVGAGYASIALGSAATYNAVVVGLMAAGLSVSGGLLVISIALVALIALGAAVFDHFDTIFDELTANREDFICQVYNSSNETEARQVFYDVAGVAVTNLGVSDGVKDQLGNAVVGIIDALVPAELVVTLFKFVDQIGKPDFDCSTCPPSGQLTTLFTFDTDHEEWVKPIARADWNGTLQAIYMNPRLNVNPSPVRWQLSRTDLMARTGMVGDFRVVSMSMDLSNTIAGFDAGKTLKVQINDETDTAVFSDLRSDPSGTWNVAIPAHVSVGVVEQFAVQLVAEHNGQDTNGDIVIDNISITIEAV